LVLSHRIPDGLFWVAANEAKKETHALFNYTDPGFTHSAPGHPLSSSVEQWTQMHHIDRKAVERSKAAYASIAITKRLTLSYSGLCNNVAQPEWGTSHTAFSRILKPVYADGL
ncbi:hypothetical protein GCK32_020576, partial [Trichostrongylus colubriformis]